jgi:hypothetical protein
VEVTMDKVWLYVGGLIVGAVVLITVALTVVSKTNPPATDLRSAYETAK